MEEFRTVIGFNDYEISNLGNLRTKSRRIRYVLWNTGEEKFRQSKERLLKPFYNSNGYQSYHVYRDKKMYNVYTHRVIAEAFIPRIDGKEWINHIDGNGLNNAISNLEWCTPQENVRHTSVLGRTTQGIKSINAKLNNESVIEIKKALLLGHSCEELARKHNMSSWAISDIKKGKNWKHISIENKYANKLNIEREYTITGGKLNEV